VGGRKGLLRGHMVGRVT